MFITHEQNLLRDDAGPEGMGLNGGLAYSRRRVWGERISKLFMSARPQSHAAIDGGQRFDLPTSAYGRPVRLEWRNTDTLAAFGDDLEHLAEFGAQVGSIYLEHAIGNPVFEYEFTVPWGTQFIYQPALTAEELADGSVRAQAVVGSYAIYAAHGGKLAHLLRPVARSEATGDEVWGQVSATLLRQQADGDVWSVVISFPPSTGINALNYPIWIDGNATMGYSSLGGSSTAPSKDYVDLFGAYASVTGTATSMWLGCHHTDPPNRSFTLGVYDNAMDLVGDTGEVDPPVSKGWREATFDSPITLNAGEVYWFAQNHEGGGLYMWFDAHPLRPTLREASVYVSGTLPASLTLPTTSPERWFSVYAEVTPTPAGGVAEGAYAEGAYL